MSISRRTLLASAGAACLLPGRLTLAAAASARPRSRARPFSEVVHGIRVDDPYRWMEDSSDPAWPAALAEQSRYSRAFLDDLPGRRAFLDRINALTSGDMPGDAVQAAGGHIFTFRRNRGSETMNLLVRDGPTGADRVLVDASKLGTGGATAGIDYYWNASPDGRHVVFASFENGSEELTLRVVEVESGKLLPDSLAHVDMSERSWAPDGSGFFYTRLSPGEGSEKYNNTSVWFHRLGTAPSQDILSFRAGIVPGVEARASDGPGIHTVAGSDYVLAFFLHVGNQIDSLYVAPIADAIAGRARWRRVAGANDGVLSATQWRDQIYLVTNKGAERGRLVTTSATAPDISSAQQIVPELDDFMISVSAAHDAVYVETEHVGMNRIVRVLPDGRWEKVAMPFDGADPIGLTTKGSEDGVWLTYQSWVRAPLLVHVGADGKVATWDSLTPSHAGRDRYEFSLEMVRARDGVEVPLSLIRRKDARRDGSIPIIMTAYGAYGTEIPTRYVPGDMAWLERGGALAVAHVRGGGELGEAWHQAALKKTKANSWRDLIDCARWLIANKWTSAGRLVIQGKSAGGITVGRALTEEPGLFAAAVMRVPAVNTTRLHLSPAGPANFPEFGDPSIAEEFGYLVGMDAYLHVEKGVAYPPVMLTAAMNDGRIPAWVPAKMAARLQDASCNPAILRVETEGGHGLGATRDQENAERADIFAFSWWAAHRPAGCPVKRPVRTRS
ncbi:MAG TPA: prolyl oligopeptidase family serine peptidase [Sphingomicrobium sp.]